MHHKTVAQENIIYRYLHRRFVWLVTLLLMAAPRPSPLPPLIGFESLEARIAKEALAPPTGGVLRSLDPIRTTWIQLEEHLGPIRPDETPIHRAIREVERLLQEGERRQAMALSQVLAFEVVIARWSASSQRLMDQWNFRFPSGRMADVTETTLDQLDDALDGLFNTPEYIAAKSATDEIFLEWIWRARFEDAEAFALSKYFETHADMQEALSDILELEADFRVGFPKAAWQRFKRRSPLSILVCGPKTVGWLMTTIEDGFPWLRSIGWGLRIDGEVATDARAAINPIQRIRIILPRDAA